MSKGLDSNISAAAFTGRTAGFTAVDAGLLNTAPLRRTETAGGPPAFVDLSGPIVASDKQAVRSQTAPEAITPPPIPDEIKTAIKDGKQIKFTSTSDDPDFVLRSDGKLVANTDPNHKKSPDGSLKIGVQNQDLQGKSLQDKSVVDAIKHDADMQKAAAQEMIRLFQQDPANKGKAVPEWMKQLANVQPQLPDVTQTRADTPPAPAPEQASGPASPAPENGFRQNCAPSNDPGAAFRGNGGFDGEGNFRGNGSDGDGTIWSGQGRPQNGESMGAGEQVKAKDVYDYLKTHQFSDGTVLDDKSCSGILGNIQTECHFKTGDINHIEGAHGLCQWEKERWSGPDGLANFAAHFQERLKDEAGFKAHLDSHLSDDQKTQIYNTVVADVNKTIQHDGVQNLWTNKYVQMEFAFHELETSHHSTLTALAEAQRHPDTESASKAAHIWQARFEVSDNSNLQPRMNNAESIHADIVHGKYGDNQLVASNDSAKKNTATG
jgi:hypothetical protein